MTLKTPSQATITTTTTSTTTTIISSTSSNNNNHNDFDNENVPFLLSKTFLQDNNKVNNNNYYEPLSIDGDEEEDVVTNSSSLDDDDDDQKYLHADEILQNFTRMCILFSINHGSVVACLALATSQLGNIGATQTSILYISYTISALCGISTFIVKHFIGSPRNSLALGMGLYCIYVGCFVIVISTTTTTTNSNSGNIQSTTITSNNEDDDNIDDYYYNYDNDTNNNHNQKFIAYTGAIIGGIGAGLIWVAQGTYFNEASKEYSSIMTLTNTKTKSSSSSSSASASASTTEAATSLLAGKFAFWYLIGEVASRLISSLLLELNLATWREIFGLYTIMAILSTIGMRFFVYEYYPTNTNNIDTGNGDDDDDDASHFHYDDRHRHHHHRFVVRRDRRRSAATTTTTTTTLFYKITAAIQLLCKDPKMKYMICLNAVFGFSSSFITTYVNGEVLPIVLKDTNNKYVGIYTSWTSAVAAIMSLVFGGGSGSGSGGSGSNNSNRQQESSPIDKNNNKAATAKTINSNYNNNNNNNINRKGRILILGSLCFMGVVLPFMIMPDVTNESYWSWKLLVFVYGFHGIGRATFEGTLKATFADFFGYESEGAFANIIFQSGLSSAIGSILAFNLPCHNPSGQYCIEYRDGSYQRILWLELIVAFLAIFAIVGYLRAARLHERETWRRQIFEHQTKD